MTPDLDARAWAVLEHLEASEGWHRITDGMVLGSDYVNDPHQWKGPRLMPGAAIRRRLALLVEAGLVERSHNGPRQRWRITQAGRDALAARREATEGPWTSSPGRRAP